MLRNDVDFDSKFSTFLPDAAATVKEDPTAIDNTSNSMVGEPILTSQLVLTDDPANTISSSDLVRQLMASRRYHCPACSYQVGEPNTISNITI
jgi:hypothetical protein